MKLLVIKFTPIAFLFSIIIAVVSVNAKTLYKDENTSEVNTCTSWNLSSDIRTSPNQENPNRDSCGDLNVWYFMGSNTIDRNPLEYYLLPNFISDTKGVPGLQSWQGDNTEPTIPENTQLPLVGINTTDSPEPNWPVSSIVVHPWQNTGMAIIGWRSPIDGTISINGIARDDDSGNGDGIAWFIDKETTNLASGGFYDGGTQSFVDGVGGDSLQNIAISKDEFIYFIVSPKANDYQDTTQLEINISMKENLCEIPFLSQVDDSWENHPLRTNPGGCSEYCSTIGHCGCTLTSATMVFNTYNAETDPAQVSDCMGTSACPYNWFVGANCSSGKATFVGRPNFSWGRLDAELNNNHRPVILGMCKTDTCYFDYDDDPNTYAQTHWVLVLSGQGNDPANYSIHDPAFKCGASLSLNTRSDDWTFQYLGIYKSNIPCTSLSIPIPSCSSYETNPQPVQFSQPTQADLSSSENIVASPASTISGTVWIYTRSEITLTLEITASSSLGDVTDVIVWSDSTPNTTWQPYTPFVWLPVSDTVFVKYRDNLGNESNTYSSSLNPIGPPAALYFETYLPTVTR